VVSVNGGRSEGSAGRGRLEQYCVQRAQRPGRAAERASSFYYWARRCGMPLLYTASSAAHSASPRAHVRTSALPTSTATHTAQHPGRPAERGGLRWSPWSRLSQLPGAGRARAVTHQQPGPVCLLCPLCSLCSPRRHPPRAWRGWCGNRPCVWEKCGRLHVSTVYVCADVSSRRY
jgi:hypothetical protein